MTRAPITAEAWNRDRDSRAAPMCGFPFPHRSLAEIECSRRSMVRMPEFDSGDVGSNPAASARS